MPTDGAMLALIALALLFTFLNGFNDAGALVATMVTSGVLTPRRALLLAASAEFCGPFLIGVAVAGTIGQGVIVPGALTVRVLVAALAGASLWGVAAGRLGVPTSATHALIGGMVGAGVVESGLESVSLRGLILVAMSLAVAPTLGLVGGFVLMRGLLVLGRRLTPAANVYMRGLLVVTSALVALSHGANDAQKGMGLITAGLLAGGAIAEFAVPAWAVVACAATIALGVALGGQRTLRTLGMRIYTVRPIHGLAAQSTTATLVIVASLLGGPVSTVQVGVSAIFGAGAGERISKVRWLVADNIVLAWLVTLPVAGLLGGGLALVGQAIFG